jgi:hypothetical protein
MRLKTKFSKSKTVNKKKKAKGGRNREEASSASEVM